MEKTLKVVKVTWAEVKQEVYKVNPVIAEILDELKNVHEFPLYKAVYAFGNTILQKNQFYLPGESNTTLPLDNPYIPATLQESLGYHSSNVHGIPLGLILRRTVELYRTLDETISSFRLYKEGDVLGLWDILSDNTVVAPKLWSMTAGARNVFFLPKISNRPSMYKLCKARDVRHMVPKDFAEQGPLLYEIAQYHDVSKDYNSTILFFSKEWKEALKEKSFLPLKSYLQERVSEEMIYWRNKIILDTLLDNYVKKLWDESVKINTYTVYIVKQLLAVAFGSLPGFAPSIKDEVGPLDSIRKDFLEIYGLKRVAPTIMIPQHIHDIPERCVYWSLALPCHDISPKQNYGNSVLKELKEVKILLEGFRDGIIEGSVECAKDTLFYDFMANTRFEFYHSDVKEDEDLRQSRFIEEEDSRFAYSHAQYGKREFADSSLFTRAIVKIRRIEE